MMHPLDAQLVRGLGLQVRMGVCVYDRVCFVCVDVAVSIVNLG